MSARLRVLLCALALAWSLFFLAGSAFGQRSDAGCRAAGTGPSIDHVVIAVKDLGSAEADFRALGLAPTRGHLHSNGLINSHIEFADGTELELMSILGNPADEVAAGYERFLAHGDGGAFLAIRADPGRVMEAARALGLDAQVTHTRAFTWVTVNDSRTSPSGQSSPIFFISYSDLPGPPGDSPIHDAGITGISSVRFTGTRELEQLLLRLGAVECAGSDERAVGSDWIVGLSNGELVLVRDPGRGTRPAVLEVGLRREGVVRAVPHDVLDPERTHGVRLIVKSLSRAASRQWPPGTGPIR